MMFVERRTINWRIVFYLLWFCIPAIIPTYSYAEGGKELLVKNDDRLYLYLNGNLYNSFGRYDGNSDQRLYFRIQNPEQEQVYLGFSESVSSGHYPCTGDKNIVFFRIKDPNGNIVYPNRNSISGKQIDGSNANITQKSQMNIGPKPIGGQNGYEPFVFDPSGLDAGDYYIEFSSIENIATPNVITAIEYWDITVATKTANPTAINGRIFALDWSFYAPSIDCGSNSTYGWFDRPFNGQFHVLSPEGFVTQVDFEDAGFQPAAFNTYFNKTGTDNTGDLIEDRKSKVGLGQHLAVHKIFLNNPDPNVFLSGEYGTINSTPELHICNEDPGNGCILIETTKTGQIEILIDFDTLNGSFIYDSNSRDVLLVYNIEAEAGETSLFQRCIPWDGKDGLGNSVTNQNAYDILVTYQQGIFHIPFYDVEYLLNGITTTNIRPIPPSGNLQNKFYFDDTNIPFSSGFTNTSKSELNGCDAPCHIWQNRDYGNNNTINTWFFADEESRVKGEIPHCLIEANPDNVVTLFETPIEVAVLTNDVGTIIDTNSVQIIASTPNGSFAISPEGIITYTPADDFSGLDSFQYSICYDLIPKGALCDDASVYVIVGEEKETNCMDNIDNDKDGKIDCDDSDCLPATPPIIHRKTKKS